MVHPTSLPRLSAGQLSRATACSRHLAQLLDPDRRSGGVDPSFRLWRAIHDALHDSHRLAADAGASLADHLPRTAPLELGHEERRVFTRTLEHYEEAFGGDTEAQLDVRAGETLSRPSACGRYQLSAQANLLFRRPSSPLEVRRIKLRSRPASALTIQPGDVALVALLRPPHESSDVVAVVHTLWAGGEATVTSQAISSADVDELRSSLRERVDAALANPNQTVPGWWCGTCPFLLRCPAIPQDSPETLLQRWPAEVGSNPLQVPWTVPAPDLGDPADVNSDDDW